jgi:hypothetical protein
MTTIVYQFAEKNILIKSVGPHQYSFSFNGSEDEFVKALLEVMDIYNYKKQDENWFPGDPIEENNDAYYIENDDEEVYMAFNWTTKEVVIS